ncbi:hypothetical protein K1719_009013 [Acacia pycnantha]|nr:hypothetical protein K1719_009013 [Acacia pycnantha]
MVLSILGRGLNGKGWRGCSKKFGWCLHAISLWQEKFVNAEVKVVPRVCSDHHPLVVCLEASNICYRHKPFRYEAAWQMHGNFEVVIKENWQGEDEAHVKLSNLKQSLVQWNKDTFGNIESKKRGS